MWFRKMFPAGIFACCWALSVLVCLLEDVGALPSGAPSMACSSMRPIHFAFQPQSLDHSPFAVRQSKLRYHPGANDTVTVTLTVKNGHPRRAIKGFLVKGLNPLTNHSIGQFREQFDVGLRRNCHAATHVNNHNKAQVILHWTPEDDDEEGNWVVFEATIVETFRKFFVGLQSTSRGRPARERIEEKIKEQSHSHEHHDEDPEEEVPSKTNTTAKDDLPQTPSSIGDRVAKTKGIESHTAKPDKSTDKRNPFWFM